MIHTEKPDKNHKNEKTDKNNTTHLFYVIAYMNVG